MFVVKKSTYILVFAALLVVLLAWQCNAPTPQKTTVNSGFLNLADSAKYVGMQTCAQCHPQHAQTFVHTGMGQSFDTVSKQRSALKNHAVLYDQYANFYYQPFWKNNQLLVREFRLKDADTVYSRTQKIDYIIGSGQHTNSHIFSSNGYLFQAPFTVYTQTEKLDFPPGFEGGNNSRFSRPIGLECMSCHNAMPHDFVPGSQNKFDAVPNGIDCERCHGPGSLHVAKIQRGEITDTAVETDFSIVNPKKLSAQLQFELCQRCHLQGNAVLAPGKSFLDFKPGMYLDSVLDVYLPRHENSDDAFIMASHADRLKQSACFKNSNEKLTCISCHNPHVSVVQTNKSTFNNTCKSCHSAPEEEHKIEGFYADTANCVACHMPKSGSSDIPHVTVHDHKIGVHHSPANQSALGAFLGLESINNPNPSLRSKIKAYLQQYERFTASPIFLDSAENLLQRADTLQLASAFIHLYYLQNAAGKTVSFVEKTGGTIQWISKLNQQSLNNADAWTAYRIAEAYYEFTDYYNALSFCDVAIKLAPYILEFRIKKGAILVQQKQFAKALPVYEFVVGQNPQIAEAWSDLGYVHLALNNLQEAEKCCIKSLKLNPDYTRGALNLASVYLAKQQFKLARQMLLQILEKEPTNNRVLRALTYVNAQIN